MPDERTTGTTDTGPNESGHDHRAMARADDMSRAYSGGQYNTAIAGVDDDDRPVRQDVNESGFDHTAIDAARGADGEPDDGGGVNGAMGGFCDDR